MLIIREAQETGRLPSSQAAIFSSPRVLKYLQEKTAKANGTDPLVRVWDDDYTDEQLANSPAVMRDAYKRIMPAARGHLPWIAISNGTDGHSGPLPLTVEDTMELLRKYGG